MDYTKPGAVGAIDQAQAALRTMSDTMAMYYKNLVAQGVPIELASMLTMQLQALSISSMGKH